MFLAILPPARENKRRRGDFQVMTVILVINSGSSSLKWKLTDGDSYEEISGGIVELPGPPGEVTLHLGPTMRSILAGLGDENPSIVGHRVVHGGNRFREATLVTDEAEVQIGDLSTLAPLHNPANLAGSRLHATPFSACPISRSSTPPFTKPFRQPRLPMRS